MWISQPGTNGLPWGMTMLKVETSCLFKWRLKKQTAFDETGPKVGFPYLPFGVAAVRHLGSAWRPSIQAAGGASQHEDGAGRDYRRIAGSAL